MVGGSDRTEDRGLLLVVGEALTSKVRASALRDLKDDGSLDIPAIVVNTRKPER
jgi:hypothetical protein